MNPSRVVVCLLVAVAASASARADEPAAEPWKPSAPVRVTHGEDPWLSPSGERLAFRRPGLDLADRDERGQPQVVPLLHVRDVATGAERRASRNGEVTGWAGDDLLVLADGTGVRVAGAGDEPRFPSAPEGASVAAFARSPDGRRVAFTRRGFAMEETRDPARPLWTIHLVEGDAAPRRIELGALVNPDESDGLLAFSPGGERLAFHLGFMHHGQLPHPRAGVVDLRGGKATFLRDEPAGSRGSEDEEYETGPAAGGAWDARGTRFAFVGALGPRRRDLFVAVLGTGRVHRLTADGGWKASPCLSPDGTRLAYWVADPAAAGAARRGGWEDARRTLLRVLHLASGEEVALPTPGTGSGSDLQWSPDGRTLWFAWSAAEGDAVFTATAPPPSSPTSDDVVDRSPSPVDDVLEALRSDDENEVEAALDRSRTLEDPRIVPALRAVLRRRIRRDRQPYTVVQALLARGAVSAVPELLEQLATGEWTSSVTEPLLDWEVDAAVPMWRRIVVAGPPSGRPSAAVALARLGEPGAWESVARLSKDPEEDVRGALARALSHARDARAVEILISLLGDDARLYTSVDGDRLVGHEAADALKRLTGKAFGRDAAAWTTWWEGAGRRLPEAADR